MSFGDIFSYNFVVYHLISVGIFAMLALSLNLINGYAGMFSLGHQAFWAVGAYGAGAVIVHFPFQAPGVVVFGSSLLAGIGLAALAGFVIGVPCLRLRGDYLAIATLGFAEIVRILLNNFDWVGGSRGLAIPRVLIEKTPATEVWFYLFFLVFTVAMTGLTVLVCRNLIHSSHGRAIVSIREDEVASELIGVNVTYYKVVAFLIGAAFAGLAGAIHANFFGIISPKDFGIMPGILILLMVVLGGMGSMSGTLLATVILYFVQQILKLKLFGLPSTIASAIGWPPLMRLADTMETLAVDRWQVFFAILLILLMISAPQGFFGKREIWDTAAYKKLAGLFRSGGRGSGSAAGEGKT